MGNKLEACTRSLARPPPLLLAILSRVEEQEEKKRKEEEKEVHSSGEKPCVCGASRRVLPPLDPFSSSTLFFHSISPFFSLSLSLSLTLSLTLLTPSFVLLSPYSVVWSQKRVDHVAHMLQHRCSNSLERPPALHPLRRAALLKIQPFLGRSTNRRQLTAASYVSVVFYHAIRSCVFFYVASLFFFISFFLHFPSFLLFFLSSPLLIRSKVRCCTHCRYTHAHIYIYIYIYIHTHGCLELIPKIYFVYKCPRFLRCFTI